MKLKNLSLRDKKIFDRYLRLARHELSVYAFANVYIWKGLFDIQWVIIADSLCVFFKDKIGAFLYLSPLSKQLKPEVVQKVFGILDELNLGSSVSRIENAEDRDSAYYRSFGYECAEKSCDYLYQREDLVQLKGNDFKSKRSSINYFVKHYRWEYLAFSQKQHKQECLKLYNLWMQQRKYTRTDALYQALLNDSFTAFQILLNNYRDLDCLGRLIKVNGQIKGLTFGFKLNQRTFCVLYEITDLSLKGLAQFIFREFCRELVDYKYINIMDDSGLANLKRVKLSYSPKRLVPAYIVRPKSSNC